MGTSTHDAMTSLLALTRSLVRRVEHVSVTMRRSDGGGLHTPWSSTDVARQLDELQYGLRQGPCVEAVETGCVCHVVLADAEPRWPELVGKVSMYEVGSVLSTPLSSTGGVRGALNAYSPLSEPFGDAALTVARQLAGLAAAIVAWGEPSTSQPIAEATASRDAILRAQGVLMAWQGCPPEEAFAILRRTSQRDRRRLRDVAEQVLACAQRLET